VLLFKVFYKFLGTRQISNDSRVEASSAHDMRYEWSGYENEDDDDGVCVFFHNRDALPIYHRPPPTKDFRNGTGYGAF